jgi:hypothetical protein
MGRFLNQADPLVTKKLTETYDDSGSTFNDDGYLTSYTANGVSITAITYETDVGFQAGFGAEYQKVTGWTEEVNGISQDITVTYDNDTGRVSAIVVT